MNRFSFRKFLRKNFIWVLLVIILIYLVIYFYKNKVVEGATAAPKTTAPTKTTAAPNTTESDSTNGSDYYESTNKGIAIRIPP